MGCAALSTGIAVAEYIATNEDDAQETLEPDAKNRNAMPNVAKCLSAGSLADH